MSTTNRTSSCITGMKPLFYCLTFLLSVSFTSTTLAARFPADSIIVDQNFHFQISYPYTSNAQLLEGLKKTNDKLLYIAILTIEKEQTPLSVSKYTSTEAQSIEDAFESNVKFRPANGENFYKLINHGEVKKEGKVLRYKISEITFASGAKTNSILYYFMPNGRSKDLYELKLVCTPEKLDRYKEVVETIALSVNL